MAKNKKEWLWLRYLQVVVPVFLFIISVYISQINSNINDVKADVKDYKTETNKKIDGYSSQVFTHLTNDEMHCPRSMVVSKVEFNMYRDMIQTQSNNLIIRINEVKNILEKR